MPFFPQIVSNRAANHGGASCLLYFLVVVESFKKSLVERDLDRFHGDSLCRLLFDGNPIVSAARFRRFPSCRLFWLRSLPSSSKNGLTSVLAFENIGQR